MQLKYEHLDYQKQAIDSIVDLFQGEITHHQDDFSLSDKDNMRVIANELSLSKDDIFNNLKNIQTQNQLSLSDKLDNLYFSVEMETGTGKTFVYLNTIFELYQRYGWRKFIIVVPSVAIREGVLQTLNSTKAHFKDEFNSPIYHYGEYSGQKTNALKHFATSTNIEILVMNIQSFEKESNIINQQRENGVLMELIQATNPIIIIDEPQNISSDKRKNAIENLNPLFTVGYSATHKEIINKVYSLNPVQAFEKNLVKQIVVNSVISQDKNNAFIELKEITNKSGLKAKIIFDISEKQQLKRKAITVKLGDDLYEKSKQNPNYQGFIITGIDLENQMIKFSNGIEIARGVNMDCLRDEIMKQQIHYTIKEHLKHEKELNKDGIKVLSLFFIDKVENYRTNAQGELGKFYEWFEELYELETKQSASGVHKGYFSQDKKGNAKNSNGTTKDDNDAYELIMKDKERLLSLDEPVRFIFSHSALKEGWDNPNVFQICTLNETTSVIKKRQEIGRGLRLPVNQKGERIYDEKVNILTVIPNESYEQFANSLQQEYIDDCGIKFEKSHLKNAKNERTVTYRFDAFTDPLFLQIWERIRHKTSYRVQFDSDELIDNASQKIHVMPKIDTPKIEIKKARMVQNSETGIETQEIFSQSEHIQTKFVIPDILKVLQQKTGLTRNTLVQILQQSGRIDEVKSNPQRFIETVAEIINDELYDLMKNGIYYQKLDKVYEQSLFKTYKIYANQYTFNVNKMDKTIYNGVLDLDSNTENQFATDCENYDEQVAFYFKLPKKFKIPTPIGNYNPDWAVVIKKNGEQVYFIAETKNTGDKSIQDGVVVDKLKWEERFKIACAKRFFEINDEVDYQVVQKINELT
ncbi:restriction endonuclease [Moraxella catarrhalis]|uniref:restriction endonuclease n=1 Tax=Moraxella catarrhalis TaxID=480 RepID=UPI00051CBACF|nr:DEAD/DEAH box helicase family protein [Moraxella catarrhalis]AIT42822.1 type III restriction-modification system StyLTI enzyme res [Moraxella catarrhalis]ARB67249.1 DEAD/DEAH box helicase [Moraxella catarrhalis]KZR94795.1 DEAD/DEAH box helicase [Moraxella catarrhalis]MCG6819606.1 DEAD/DEAH box helicase family protein [Moraxella catarrhalis]MCG6831090.1 DEAD/DEAH box helicase family protein [Moraxella catarrhalis]